MSRLAKPVRELQRIDMFHGSNMFFFVRSIFLCHQVRNIDTQCHRVYLS
jgi:hypothetical protein